MKQISGLTILIIITQLIASYAQSQSALPRFAVPKIPEVVGAEQMIAEFKRQNSDEQISFLRNFVFTNKRPKIWQSDREYREIETALRAPGGTRNSRQIQIIENLISEAAPSYWQQKTEAEDACKSYRQVLTTVESDPGRYLHLVKLGSVITGSGVATATAAKIATVTVNNKIVRGLAEEMMAAGFMNDVTNSLINTLERPRPRRPNATLLKQFLEDQITEKLSLSHWNWDGKFSMEKLGWEMAEQPGQVLRRSIENMKFNKAEAQVIVRSIFTKLGLNPSLPTSALQSVRGLGFKVATALSEEVSHGAIEKALQASPQLLQHMTFELAKKLETATATRRATIRTSLERLASKFATSEAAKRVVMSGVTVASGGAALLVYAGVDVATNPSNLGGALYSDVGDVISASVSPTEFCGSMGFASDIRRQIIEQRNNLDIGISRDPDSNKAEAVR